MIHIYEGNGKGKTTAACGLAVRAAGSGIPVFFAQFLKDGSSGEIRVLKKIPGISVRTAVPFYGFVRSMSGEEKKETAEGSRALLREAAAFARGAAAGGDPGSADRASLIVLDEILHVVKAGLLGEEELTHFLDELPCGTETVLTGYDPSPALLARADYVTRMECLKHPYENGTAARKGIEF